MMNGADLGAENRHRKGPTAAGEGQAKPGRPMSYLIGLIERFAKQPGDGLLSKLVHDDGPDGRMTPSEIASNTPLLLIAGHDFTVNLIAHCILMCLRNSGIDRSAAAAAGVGAGRDRGGASPPVVGAVLSVAHCLADIEIEGTIIPKGSPIFLLYAAGNRDPRRFHNPTLRPARKDNQHLGWGSGIHTCFGGPLARLEVNTAFEAFLHRVENPRLVVDPPPYRRSQVFRGPRHLLVDLDGIETRGRAVMKTFQFVACGPLGILR